MAPLRPARGDAWAQRLWYGGSRWAWLLLPFSLLFAALAALRRTLYRAQLLRTVRVGKPVIVIGNLTVGGTGKTPLVIWLTLALKRRGFIPGVITRGYGASHDWPIDVNVTSDAGAVGDEAVLIAAQTEAIVVACKDRVRAARRAIERGANVLIADDGLQHYRLVRDVEIAVVDAARRFGNGWPLPAGPLRESPRRLRCVDLVVRTVRDDAAECAPAIGHAREFVMRFVLGSARALASDTQAPLASFAGRRVHALAGIGDPEAFFAALRARGLQVDARALNDHARITAEDLRFDDDAPVLMTEKDAVKCAALVDARCWSVPLNVELERAGAFLAVILQKLDRSG